jgi:hypothetical protein
MSATLRITTDELKDAGRLVEKVGAAAQSGDVRLVMGNAVANALKDRFAEIAQDQSHHVTASRLGAVPTGFYEQARQGVQLPSLEPEGVSVAINKRGIAQRVFGGTITRVKAKALAIPARAEAYGKLPSEFNNLRLVVFGGGKAALVERTATVVRGGARGAGTGRSKGDEIGGNVFFWLVKSVHQEPDPTILPDEEKMLNDAIARAGAFLERFWNNARSAGGATTP